jgi:hypothetical protein
MMKLVLVALLASLVGCASMVFENTPGSIDPGGTKVEAEASYFSFFMLAPSFEAADLMEDLRSKCGGKRVSGITLEVSSRFLFGQLVNLEATGYCVDG